MTIVDQLASFVCDRTAFEDLPAAVVGECKRVLLDSLGCALAAVDTEKGRQAMAHGRRLGEGVGQATIIGCRDRVSVFGAAFANGELVNALDFDAILAPGHVAPYVLPGALAIAEDRHASGRDLICALAAAHEMSFRFGKAMSLNRDVVDGNVATAEVLGYASTVFGATAAITRLRGFDHAAAAVALAVAASISPVNSHRSWLEHAPSATIKYLLSGWLAQAASMADLGHRGDREILDDSRFGYARFIGTSRWEPATLTDGLGERWWFPDEQSYKPYPQVRVTHALIDTLSEILETEDIRPGEIEAIRAWGEGWTMLPTFLNRDIQDVHDAQFSMAHGLAIAAQRVIPGRDWQAPELVFDADVLGLMDRVTVLPHPDFAAAIAAHPAARPSHIEVDARDRTFVAERAYVKGSPSPDPTTLFTDDELEAKFRHNAGSVLRDDAFDDVVSTIGRLELLDNVAALTSLLRAET